MELPPPAAPSHLLISGTGRSGTSFLVRFLGACGLDIGEGAEWHERARAGLEHSLRSGGPAPYVVKDPWLWTYCRDLDLERLKIDGLIVPMRQLDDAAASRVLQERMAIATTNWVGQRDLDVFGSTPGGALFSLTLADQARILAVGFHDLVWWAVENGIPIHLLAFPRLVDDPAYLVDRLMPGILGGCTREHALAAHAQLAEPESIRVSEQRAYVRRRNVTDEQIDREALIRRNQELERELEVLRQEQRRA